MPAGPLRMGGGSTISRLITLQIFVFAGNALSKPYINLYLVSLGMSASRLGLLLSIGALVEMAVIPVMTAAADRWGKHRWLYTGFVISLIVGNALLVSSEQFWVLALATVVIEGTFRPHMALGFQLVITQVTNEGRNIAGRIRGISSLGFGLASIMAGPLYSVVGYTGLFFSAAASYATGLVFRNSLPASISDPADNDPPDNAPPDGESNSDPVPAAPRSRGFYLLMVSMFFLMMSHRAGYAFWFVHFQQNLDVSTGEIGRFAALMALVEIPFFILLDPILKRVDVRLAFVLGAIGMSLVWLGTGFIPSKGWIYPLLVARGFAFAAFYFATFLVIVQISVPQNVATNQALLQGTIPSLATVLTSPISGWLYDVAGPQALYSAVTITSLIGIGIIIVGYRTLNPSSVDPVALRSS